jgi:phosphatidylglycerol:prolipoprotein diacylglycerol transferase
MAPLGVPLHPTQLYEAVALVILGFVLWRARSSMVRLGPGSLAATYLIGNAVIRFALFFLRDDIALVGGLKVAQVVALGIAVGGIAWLASVLRARPREAFGV